MAFNRNTKKATTGSWDKCNGRVRTEPVRRDSGNDFGRFSVLFCYHSDYLFATNIHCYISMKY